MLMSDQGVSDEPPSKDQLRLLHATIQKVTTETEEMRFNTAIAAMMEFINGVSEDGGGKGGRGRVKDEERGARGGGLRGVRPGKGGGGHKKPLGNRGRNTLSAATMEFINGVSEEKEGC